MFPVNAVTDLKKNQIAGFHFDHNNLFVARTGYTGEDGFEIVGSGQRPPARLWDKILAAGAPFGIKPCGLGARDTLRTEVCYPLYGHELDENTTPIEAGVGFFVALDKGEFNGRAVLAEQKSKRRAEKTRCIQDDGQIRAAAAALSDLGKRRERRHRHQRHAKSVAEPRHRTWAMFRRNLQKPDTKIEIEIRGKRFAAVVVPKPIFKKL